MVEPDVVTELPRLVMQMDEPVADPAILAAYLVCKEARKHVTVMLSGVGGDEIFAGYRKYRAQDLASRYLEIPAGIRESLIEPFVNKLPVLRGSQWKGYVRLAKKMVRTAPMEPRKRFIANSVYLDGAQIARLCKEETLLGMGEADPTAHHWALMARAKNADPLNQLLYVDSNSFLVSLNLLYNDKMSMASSVEVRVPFLDHEMAEWVAQNVPPNLKMHGGTTKYVLRQAVKPLLPAEVMEQGKAGFGAPVDYWLSHDLREMVDDLLSEGRIRQRGLFEASAVRELIEQQREGREDWSQQIWQFLVLELWMQAYLDGNKN
jgi:asparagine synthase (glutamine-hydrolysing)